jgi:peptidoglycan L-alanyl-D-glutamate endopeptidase CwlK
MPKFSNESMLIIPQLHPQLQAVMFEAIEWIDFKLICGFRGKEAQDEAVRNGHSKLEWPKSKHNTFPARAVDVVPYFQDEPHIRWNESHAFYMLAGYIKAVADNMAIKIRWGGNWLDDNDYKKPKFIDLPHIELTND